jgi:UDP-N-acetylglucosamine--N-acetylmuramyl-(pentapeptide) pyrophosphoryl-undecaprenol N-acetylglucosamine transferase
MVEERDLSGDRLAGVIETLLADRGRLRQMGEAARTLARPDAAARVADRVEQLGGYRAG